MWCVYVHDIIAIQIAKLIPVQDMLVLIVAVTARGEGFEWNWHKYSLELKTIIIIIIIICINSHMFLDRDVTWS